MGGVAIAKELTKENAYGRIRKIEIQGRTQYQDVQTGDFVSNDIGRVVTQQGKAYGNISVLQSVSPTAEPRTFESEEKRRLLASIQGIATSRNISRSEAKEQLKKFLRDRADKIGEDNFSQLEDDLRRRHLS